MVMNAQVAIACRRELEATEEAVAAAGGEDRRGPMRRWRRTAMAAESLSPQGRWRMLLLRSGPKISPIDLLFVRGESQCCS